VTITQTGATEAQARLEAIAARLADITPVMQVAAADTMTLIDDSFAGSRAPDGSPWAPLSQSTLRQRTASAADARTRALRRHARAADETRGEMRLVSRRDADGVMVHTMRLVRTRRSAERLESDFGHLVSSAGVTILVDTGRLRGSMFARGTRTGLAFGTNTPYAAPHQTGGRRLPQRAFLPVEMGAAPRLMSTGPAGTHWTRVRDSVRRYIATGEVA
jgi:phage gpG-like protein